MMKKILKRSLLLMLVMMLVMCMTSCGNDEIKSAGEEIVNNTLAAKDKKIVKVFNEDVVELFAQFMCQLPLKVSAFVRNLLVETTQGKPCLLSVARTVLTTA